jgi:hypothetical protein
MRGNNKFKLVKLNENKKERGKLDEKMGEWNLLVVLGRDGLLDIRSNRFL